ncbi:class I SAM-dependent methyltransferase [Sutcliffiella horikoshii]|uniref:Class I SAM-dependent methyltransferase n=1 Tax=Sutcliffiella horikoshii TaxID=79883 RepID=A0A5D4SZ24_9BACI|nr:class I SAM-dependent methyltransferase [Sutcliffiella horikoshii]TYS68219.1 class I SAM-dependent methyltransferase [Sutcliffiella horikoshii]
MAKEIVNNEDLFQMLDGLLREPRAFWNDFYEDRTKEIPFFQVKGPDENLVSYFEKGLLPKRVLEIGCGPGRNAIYLAKKGCAVDAIDISENALSWAKERALSENVSINFQQSSLFEYEVEPHTYDFIYDCGLFHHLAPHRRLSYIETITKALKKGGHFGLVCFNTKGATVTSDWDVYAQRSMNGGIGYSEERLKRIFMGDFNILEFREMVKVSQPAEMFGEDFLWTSLMKVK